jgi:hypothetical protein
MMGKRKDSGEEERERGRGGGGGGEGGGVGVVVKLHQMSREPAKLGVKETRRGVCKVGQEVGEGLSWAWAQQWGSWGVM